MAKVDIKANTSARDKIFSDIRHGLGRGRLSADAQAELQGRIASHPANLIPARAQAAASAEAEAQNARRFVDKAEQSACSVAVLSDAAALPEAVAGYLRDNNLGGDIAVAPGAFLETLPWEKAPMVNCRAGTSEPSDLVSLTPALAGVAETGTLVMISGAEDGAGHPTGLNFTPDHHLVALKSSQLRAGYEEVWQLLRQDRETKGKIDMPRSLNMITGPSRTGDIGLQIHLGAHGPRRLHILLVDDAGLLIGARPQPQPPGNSEDAANGDAEKT